MSLYVSSFLLLNIIVPHQGRSSPTCIHSIKYCIRPEGHQLARPRLCSDGSGSTPAMTSASRGTGLSGIASKTSSDLASTGSAAPTGKDWSGVDVEDVLALLIIRDVEKLRLNPDWPRKMVEGWTRVTGLTLHSGLCLRDAEDILDDNTGCILVWSRFLGRRA